MELLKMTDTIIQYDELEMALEFSSSGEDFDSAAYIDTASGQIYYVSDIVDDEYPDDITGNSQYLLVPHKRELDLGKPLPIEFTKEFMPEKINTVKHIFSSRGAYSAFKQVLQNADQLENWYQFEQQKIQEALLKWSKDMNLTVEL